MARFWSLNDNFPFGSVNTDISVVDFDQNLFFKITVYYSSFIDWGIQGYDFKDASDNVILNIKSDYQGLGLTVTTLDGLLVGVPTGKFDIEAYWVGGDHYNPVFDPGDPVVQAAYDPFDTVEYTLIYDKTTKAITLSGALPEYGVTSDNIILTTALPSISSVTGGGYGPITDIFIDDSLGKIAFWKDFIKTYEVL